MKHLKIYENFLTDRFKKSPAVKQYRIHTISEAPEQEFMGGELVRRKTDGKVGTIVGFEREYKEEGDLYFSFVVEFENEEPKKYFANELDEMSEREEREYKLNSL